MKEVIRLLWILNLATFTATSTATSTEVPGINLVIEAPKEAEPGETIKVDCIFEGAPGQRVADLYQDGKKLYQNNSLLLRHNGTGVISPFTIQLPNNSKTITLQCKDTETDKVSNIVSVIVRWKVMVTIETVTSVETGSFYNVSCYMNTKDVITDPKVIVKQNNQTVDTEPQITVLYGEDITMQFLFNMRAPAEAGSIELSCLLVNRNITSITAKVNVTSTLTDKSTSHEKETKTWVVAVVVAVVFAVVVALVIIVVICWRKKKFCFKKLGVNDDSGRHVPSTDQATARSPEERGLLNQSAMSGPNDAATDANNENTVSIEMRPLDDSEAPKQEAGHDRESGWNWLFRRGFKKLGVNDDSGRHFASTDQATARNPEEEDLDHSGRHVPSTDQATARNPEEEDLDDSGRHVPSTDQATARSPEETGLLDQSTMSGPTDGATDANNDITVSIEMRPLDDSEAPAQEAGPDKESGCVVG